TFQYCVTDGKGGEDHATVSVNVIPVADVPDVSVQVLAPQAGDPINEVRLLVTATSEDTDGSDFIDRLQFGGVPGRVTLLGTDPSGPFHDPGHNPVLAHEVDVLLPTGQTTAFDLGVTAYADETEGFGSPAEASAATSQHIELDFNHNAAHEDF